MIFGKSSEFKLEFSEIVIKQRNNHSKGKHETQIFGSIFQYFSQILCSEQQKPCTFWMIEKHTETEAFEISSFFPRILCVACWPLNMLLNQIA